MFFNSLSYFCELENDGVRSDPNEGNSVYRPTEGLELHNLTENRKSVAPHTSFEATARQDEIFVFCVSRVLSDELREKFGRSCVEIRKIATFIARLQNALPSTATFIPRRVKYYDETEGPDARYALPDLIATSKFKTYKWQEEYRFLYCLTDALEFENASYQLVIGPKPAPPAKRNEYPHQLVKTRDLRDICHMV